MLHRVILSSVFSLTANIMQQQNFCLGHSSVLFKPTTTSCADLLHANIGSPDPMDILSYNILQCFKIFSNISSFLCCRATEAIECSCRATTTYTHLIEAGTLLKQHLFNYLTEAGVCSLAVAVPDAIQP
jgi:hypothetical protein